MTVGELREALAAYPPDKRIIVATREEDFAEWSLAGLDDGTLAVWVR